MTNTPVPYGEVHGPPLGEMSRRSFMRRMLGVGIGIVTLEFLAGSAAFLWPNIREGLGGEVVVGTAEQINANEPAWATGLPYAFQPARVFIVNVPAAKSLVDNPDSPESIPDPGFEVGPTVPPVDASSWRCTASARTSAARSRSCATRASGSSACATAPSTPCWAKSATVRRRVAWTASTC